MSDKRLRGLLAAMRSRICSLPDDVRDADLESTVGPIGLAWSLAAYLALFAWLMAPHRGDARDRLPASPNFYDGSWPAPQQIPLRRDLPAGETMMQHLVIAPPPTPGPYDLEVALEQVEGACFDGPGNVELRARVAIDAAGPARRRCDRGERERDR